MQAVVKDTNSLCGICRRRVEAEDGFAVPEQIWVEVRRDGDQIVCSVAYMPGERIELHREDLDGPFSFGCKVWPERKGRAVEAEQAE